MQTSVLFCTNRRICSRTQQNMSTRLHLVCMHYVCVLGFLPNFFLIVLNCPMIISLEFLKDPSFSYRDI